MERSPIDRLRNSSDVPHVVLSDVRMPGLDGFALADALGADERTSSIRIVLLTGAVSPDDRRLAVEHGVAGFIAKPFRAKMLVELVAAVI